MATGNKDDWHETTESVDHGKHGKDYEVQIAKFVFKRLLYMDYQNFRFTREKKGLGKFDDLTYIYETKEGLKFDLVQLKHIEDERKKINYDLLAENKNSYFLLSKYFEYYLESIKTIQSDKDFDGAQLENLIICTNIGIEDDLQKIQKCKLKNEELFKNSGTLFKLNISDADKRTIFAESYLNERKKLANELTYYMLLGKDIDINCLKKDDHVSLVKTYHIPLAKSVIDVEKKKFKVEFLTINQEQNDISNEILKFRDAFLSSVSEFCANCKTLTIEELRSKFKVKMEVAKNLKEKLSQYESVHYIDFLKDQILNIRTNFGDSSKFPEDKTELPMEDYNLSDVDKQIDSFLGKLVLAAEQHKTENILRKELNEETFILFNKRMDQWYHSGWKEEKSGYFIGKKEQITRKRQWITKQNILLDGMESMVLFQGRKLQLKNLTSDKGLFDPGVLMQLFCSLNITIGNEVDEMGDIKNYYIERTLKINREIEKSVLTSKHSDHFIINHPENDSTIVDTLKLSEFLDINDIMTTENAEKLSSARFIIAEGNHEPDNFDQFVQKCCNKMNIHWLKYYENRLFWERTWGSLTNLQKHFSTNVESEELIRETDLTNNRHIIIIGEPGMGKSTLVDHIAEGFVKSGYQKERPNWTIKILLKDCTEILDEMEGLHDLESAVKFLASVECDTTKFSENLLKQFLSKEKRTSLLLDGLDELYDEERVDKIIELLSFLKKNRLVDNLVVTTRPHLKEELENALGVVSHSIKEITQEEQISFLVRYWKQSTNVSEEKIHHYANKQITSFNKNLSTEEKKFLGIPLQTYMFAVIYENEIFNETPEISDNFTVTSLFDKFLKRKYEIYLVKTGEQLREKNRKQKAQLKSYDFMYQDFALIFSGIIVSVDIDVFPKLNSSIDYNMVLDIGIAYKLGKKYFFTHRTFAEYLVAKRFVDLSLNQEACSIKCREVIENTLLSRNNGFLLHIFDLKLSENSELHYSIILGNALIVQELPEVEINIKDCLERTLLYYALHYSHFNILSKLIDMEISVDFQDKFFVGTFIAYLEEFYNSNNSDLLVGKCAEIYNHIRLCEYVLKENEKDFPAPIIKAFNLKLEAYAKNWKIIELLLKKPYDNDLSEPLNVSLKKQAPLHTVKMIFDKIPDDDEHSKSIFLHVDHITIIKYIFNLDITEATDLIKFFEVGVKNYFERHKYSNSKIIIFDGICRVYYDLDSPPSLSLSEFIDLLKKRGYSYFLLVKLLMECGVSYVPGRSGYRYNWQRAEEVLDFLLVIYMKNWGLEDTLRLIDIQTDETSSIKQEILNFVQSYKKKVCCNENETVKLCLFKVCCHILKYNDGYHLIREAHEVKEEIEDDFEEEELHSHLQELEEKGWLKAVINSLPNEKLELDMDNRYRDKIDELFLPYKRKIDAQDQMYQEKRREFCVIIYFSSLLITPRRLCGNSHRLPCAEVSLVARN